MALIYQTRYLRGIGVSPVKDRFPLSWELQRIITGRIDSISKNCKIHNRHFIYDTIR